MFQPIWVEDVADCAMAVLRAPELSGSFELAGPQTLSHTEIVRLVLRSAQRRRVLAHVPTAIVSRALGLLEAAAGTGAFATWDEAELLEVSMVASRGTADARRLGVTPEPMRAVLGHNRVVG